MRRTPPSLMDRGRRKFSLDADATGDPVSYGDGSEFEAPIWGAFRQKIFSFVRSRSRSPGSRSPGNKSPGNKSPTGFKSPFSISPCSRSPSNKSPASRSPSNRSPAAKSPTRRSPSVRSPTTATASPSRGSPSVTPPLKSPPSAAVRRSSFSKASKESRSSSGEAEFLFAPGPRRSSVVASHNLKKGLGLTLKRDNTESFDSSSGTPGTGSPGTPVGGVRRGKGKQKASPGDFMDLQKMDDDLRLAEAALRPRKWSYHGTASPSTPVEAPKRHSFSTASDHKSGIVVSNNDLAKLLGQNRLLLPSLPLRDMAPLPNPKARGRSQSIAVCAQSNKLLTGKGSSNEPVAPVTIRTTDCDHLASIQAHDSIDSQKEEDEEDPEKLLWDSSGSTVNVNLLGSMIEKYLKTSAQEDDNDDEEEDEEEEEDDGPGKDVRDKDVTMKEGTTSLEPERHSGSLAPPSKGLQVK